MALPTLPKDRNGTYDIYTWPGGYPIFYLTADDGVLCAECANGQHGSRSGDADPDYRDDDQWRIVARNINWEDANLYCDHCNHRIESAYAED